MATMIKSWSQMFHQAKLTWVVVDPAVVGAPFRCARALNSPVNALRPPNSTTHAAPATNDVPSQNMLDVISEAILFLSFKEERRIDRAWPIGWLLAGLTNERVHT